MFKATVVPMFDKRIYEHAKKYNLDHSIVGLTSEEVIDILAPYDIQDEISVAAIQEVCGIVLDGITTPLRLDVRWNALWEPKRVILVEKADDADTE